MRKSLIAVFVGIVILLLICILAYLLRGVTWREYAQVQAGMSEEQVSDLLGKPMLESRCVTYTKDESKELMTPSAWIGVHVCFDEHQKVLGKTLLWVRLAGWYVVGH